MSRSGRRARAGADTPNAANLTATPVSSHDPVRTPAIAVIVPSRPVALQGSAEADGVLPQVRSG